MKRLRTGVFYILVFLLVAIIPLSIGFQPSKANMDKLTKSVFIPLKLTNNEVDVPEMESIDQAIIRLLRRNGIPGASVAVTKDDRLIYTKGFGYANVSKKEMVEPYHLFRIASASKLVTAVAIMKLAEEKAINLDDPVFGKMGIMNDSIYQHIPDKNYYKITVRHLLSHTGGWSVRSYGDPMFRSVEIAKSMGVPAPADQESIIQYVLKRRLAYKPGSYYNYSNFGYMVLGKVIEKVTGENYEDYVRRAILNPIGIYDMKLAKNRLEERAKDEVVYYDYNGASLRTSIYGTGEMEPKTYGGTDVSALEGAGGWIASPIDFMRLVSAIDGLNENDILSAESIKEMIEVPGPGFHPIGWRSVYSKGLVRTGTLAGSTALIVRRNDGVSYMVVMNSGTWRGTAFNGQIRFAMESALKKVEDWPEIDLFPKTQITLVQPLKPVYLDDSKSI
ncbi:serine hydrolase domain-containing protein [Xanthovirga aplysinae]|uniref:serine hydrolase domain-containing protein n=1 Tax=Xanthovirga aplysinae TaxID=2529853 RepID=UPI0012BB4F6E|nr:serine hydrolase domain-containing protein [Xanthovirga aplysinae]MTI30057.1 class A beta-lactamase-related serine hydrolase [Xanthovirga aplysinae]